MPAYPIRFATHDALTAADLPGCGCGHPARLHGLLVQHAGGSGCFRTYWKPGKLGGTVFAGACDCDVYRPVAPIPASALDRALPGSRLPAAPTEAALHLAALQAQLDQLPLSQRGVARKRIAEQADVVAAEGRVAS